jgi:hypothetical protein
MRDARSIRDLNEDHLGDVEVVGDPADVHFLFQFGYLPHESTSVIVETGPHLESYAVLSRHFDGTGLKNHRA